MDITVMVAQTCKYTKIIELYTLNGQWMYGYVNFISIKL